jgi:hypothetical protein
MRTSPPRWIAFGAIALVTLLAYGILIPQLGFYRDDWYLLSTAQSQGTAGIVALFQIDRPLIGYFYAVGYRLLGVSPLPWHIAALLTRLAGNLAFLWLLRLVWPEKAGATLAIALLFSIYPGFTVQPNAGVFITDLAANGAALISILLMLEAVQSSQPAVSILLSVLAGALELFYLGTFESAIGLEVARLVLVWYVVGRRSAVAFKTTLLRVLRIDLPYLMLGAGFLVWRLLIFQSTRRSTNLDVLIGRYGALPVHSLLSVVVETFKDVLETVILVWAVPFYQFVATSNYRDLAIAAALGTLAAGSVFLATRWIVLEDGRAGAGPAAHSHLHQVWLGVGITVFALLPINLAGRNVLFSDQWDRYAIYASSGVALATGGFIFHFFQASARRVLLLILIGMSVVVHYFSAAAYRDFWIWERDLWQQMVWRAPGIQRGTMLFVVLPPAGYEEGYEIYGPANIVYYPGQGLQLGGDVLNPATAANIQLQKNRQHYDRSVLVDDNYRNALIAVYPSLQSCLHVLDGRKVELPGLIDNSLVADIASYSRIELVEASAAPKELPAFLGGETPRAWCLFYEKMDLARQQGNWGEVARLADEALAKHLTPEDPSEWMPALEAYVTLGRMQDARHAASIVRSNDGARAFLCLQLQRGAAYPPPYDYVGVNQSLCQAN